MEGNKKGCPFGDSLSSYQCFLSRFNSINGANVCTGTTVGADIRIYHIDITFRNRFNRALVDTGAASCTVISYFVSHDKMI
jgi:hypothetical protein